MLLWHIKTKSHVETTFPKTFDENGSFEIGLKLLRTEESREGFFKISWITACLNEDGKMPSTKDLLITSG